MNISALIFPELAKVISDTEKRRFWSLGLKEPWKGRISVIESSYCT